jgi:hypothetical protein
MITDDDLAALISGDMDEGERAEFAEQVRLERQIVRDFGTIAYYRQTYQGSEACVFCDLVGDARDMFKPSKHAATCIWRRAMELEPYAFDAVCPSHDASTRQRDGRCYACGVKLP